MCPKGGPTGWYSVYFPIIYLCRLANTGTQRVCVCGEREIETRASYITRVEQRDDYDKI